jgi:HEAT repeat protein/Cdc6-like AAA superfamily ATPase
LSNTADSPSREIYLLENVPIQGRKTELRQLLKLLNLAKTGQPKAALITGDAGIGKTALLDTFTQLVMDSVYCRVLHLGKMTMSSPEVVYVSIIEKLQAEANHILDDALTAVNEITLELDLKWERHDLVRAIALVKLQESIGGKEAISQEQLVKAIRSQVPTVKKLKFSVNESIQKLVDIIVNPWVMIATSLLNPMSPALQEAIQLAETLRQNDFHLPQEQKLANLLNQTELRPTPATVTEAPPPVKEITAPAREPLPPVPDTDFGELSAPRPVKKLPMLVDPELDMIFEEGLRPVSEKSHLLTGELGSTHSASGASKSTSLVPAGATAPTAAVTEVTSKADAAYGPTRMDAPPRPIKDPLLRHLMTVFNFINASIDKLDSGLLIVLDEWDRIQTSPRMADLKEFFSELVLQVTEQKNYHFMIVMTARTEGESYTLGGPLYNHFRTKLLLDVLHESACRKLARGVFKDSGADLDEEIHHRLFELSRGNPFWHLKMADYIKERVESNRVRQVDMDFFDKLGLDHTRNLLELSFTRLKLTFLNDEESLYKIIAALLKHFAEEPFSASQAIREISTSQGFTDGYVFEVLRALYRHGFIRLMGATATEQAIIRQLSEQSHDGGRSRDPYYVLQSRFALEFLQEKTRMIETDISTDEKIMFLKKIIPLSVKSGDLDREKTMEVLSLGDAMGNAEIVRFLEEVFVDALHDPKPVVRVTALNNIALIDTPGAHEALFTALRDNDEMVREYAARNLAEIVKKAHDPNLANRIIDVMLEVIDDESEAVRAQIYSTLTKYRLHRDLTSVFIKGASDACEGVRLISLRNLSELEVQTPYVFNCLLEGMKDPVSEIRRYACLGLQRYTGTEAIDAIVKMLQSDADISIRSLAADSLSSMDDNKAFVALVNALRKEAAEDVKLAVVRALGKRRGWQTEAVLQEAMQTADYENMPVFTWACIRSLGQVGGTERSRAILLALKKKISNTIILSALDVAIKRISTHIDELRQMERQLEEATPVTVAIPSEYDQEVEVPEEELPDEEIAEMALIDEAHLETHRETHRTPHDLSKTANGLDNSGLQKPLSMISGEAELISPAVANAIARSTGLPFLEEVGNRHKGRLKLPFDKY